MSELITQILSIRVTEREIRSEIRKTTLELEDLQDKIKYSEENMQSKLDEAKEEFINESTEAIEKKYEPKLESVKEDIEKLQTLINSKNVDETAELAKAHETKEYLNTAAAVVNKYFEELKKVSSEYFIGLAYNEKKIKLSTFRKEFESLPYRVQKLNTIKSKLSQPFRFVEKRTENINANVAIYFTSSVMSIWVALCTPFLIFNAIKRAKYLHSSAEIYHKLMHTLITLREKTDEEIHHLFSSLLQLKDQRARQQLEEKEKELEELEASQQKEIDSLIFDDKQLSMTEQMQIQASKMQIPILEQKLEKLEFDLEDAVKKHKKLVDERTVALEKERDSYLKLSEDRKVVLPIKLLYEYAEDCNSFFDLVPGLYLYEERETVTSFLQIVLFQLRNIMEWNSVQFKVLDLLGAEFTAPLMLKNDGKAKVQDISVFSLKAERDQIIDLMHDLLIRRRLQILQTVNNLGDYNLLQKSSGSVATAYQIIIIMLNDTLRVDEKLIQLIHNGEKMGLLVFIFLKEELITLQIAKSVETYFSSFVELSSSGLSTYTPNEYVQMLEQKESDRKSNI